MMVIGHKVQVCRVCRVLDQIAVMSPHASQVALGDQEGSRLVPYEAYTRYRRGSLPLSDTNILLRTAESRKKGRVSADNFYRARPTCKYASSFWEYLSGEDLIAFLWSQGHVHKGKLRFLK